MRESYERRQRRRLIAVVHMGAARLKLDEDTRRALQQSATGCASCADMSLPQLRAVIATLNARGANLADDQPRAERQRNVPNTLQRAPYVQKIEALLADAQRPWEYAVAMAKRMFGRERLEFCTGAELRKIVAALSIDARRTALRAKS